jgi:hypothetical protein
MAFIGKPCNCKEIRTPPLTAKQSKSKTDTWVQAKYNWRILEKIVI